MKRDKKKINHNLTPLPKGQKPLPQKEDIVAFIKENPSLSGKRDIAKAFNLKGEDRIWLKDIIRDLKNEGIVSKKHKALLLKDSLPPIAMLEIFKRDSDGGFIARPLDIENERPPLVYLHPKRHSKGATIGVGDKILAKIFRNKEENGFAYSGRYIKMAKTEVQTALGILRKSDNNGYILEPIDRKSPEIRITMCEDTAAKAGDMIEVEVNKDNRYGLKQGKIRNILGRIDSEKALSMIAIISHDIPYIFSQSVMEEAENIKEITFNTVEATKNGQIEDWRDINFITIDPHDAKDHDDAVFAKKDDNENNQAGYIVYVAIADVATYVKTDSFMDKEALLRGNSVYFPDRVVPMLPERISNNLCSLKEGEDRPALAVKMVFDANGQKLKHSFHRIFMQSKAKLSYQQAQSAIDGKADEKTAPLLDTVLKPLYAAYACLKIAREKRQPLELDLLEKKIILDEKGKILDVIVPPRLDAHKLIEECMIQANVAAAETLKAKRQALIYRIHDQPSLAKQESLREFLNSLNLSLARGAELTPAKINAILKKVEKTQQQELVNQVVLRSQSQAEYTPENIGHFGLNLLNYAHFTSPIRRYADLIVHRALIKALNLGKDGLSEQQEKDLDKISASISITERRAMAAERETVDRLVAHFLADKIGASFHGRIAGVTKSGLFISLDKLGADGFIPISTLGSDYYHFDEARHALNGERSRKGYQLGDNVEIRLVEAQPIAGALRFEMLSPPRELPFSPVSHHKTKKRSYGGKISHKKRRH